MDNGNRVERLPRPDGNTVAFARTEGSEPTVVFLGGFRSDMTGNKAMALEAWARLTGRSYLRFDYLGHGQSSGRFEDGTIGRWLDDSLAVIDAKTTGRLVLIAAAPDFTERMLLRSLSPEDRALLQREGRLERPSQYSPEPSVFTWQLIEEGRYHL